MGEIREQAAVVTVVGKDQVGIIASVTSLLADYKVNIEDISQTIMQGIFNMIMLVDLRAMEKSLDELAGALHELGDGMGISIMIQHSAIFDSMHRI